jgi:hypothetical protein
MLGNVMKICPQCGKSWPDAARFCPVDGAVIPVDMPSDAKPEREDSGMEPAPAIGQFSETKWFKKGEVVDEQDLPVETLGAGQLEQKYEKTSEFSAVDEEMFSLRRRKKN